MGYWATRRGDYCDPASTMKRISCVALEAGCHLFGTDYYKRVCDTKFWDKSYMSELKFSIYSYTETFRIFKNNLGELLTEALTERVARKSGKTCG